MKIRLAKDEDFAAIARLHRQTIRKVNSKDYTQDIIRVWSARTSAKMFRESADKCKRWVAIEKEKVIGFCDHNFACEIWGLYVHNKYIGKGVGSRLLNVAEASLKKYGCKKIGIESSITAKDFYERNGYKTVKKSVRIMGDKKVPTFIMNKQLL